MLCGCAGLSAAAKAPADDTYSKDDSGVYTGGEDNMSLIKTYPTPGQRKGVGTRGGSFLKSDQAYPGCFAWNKGPGRSMDDLDMYGAQSPVIIQAAERSSLSDLRKAPSIPVMEVHDPSCGLHLQSQENLAWASRMYQPYKGQLKLAVYVNCGLLTVHVKEARQLSSSFGTECNTFVKLSLSPDETKRTKCRTSVVSETDRPQYDEKFSFELLDGDMKKRLLISLWHKENPHSHSELLGCMSFGIRHIVQKKSEVDGWYFLLSDAVGKRKHLQVGSQHHQKLNNSTTQTSEEDSERTTESNRPGLSDSSQDNMAQVFRVTVSKGPSGFGFQVSGERPAFILKIQEDSTSAQAGLLPGDHIVKVDDHDVSNLSSDTVARILKQCQGTVTLGIHRNKKPPDILQEARTPQNTQENPLLMSNKEFMPSALPNKFKFDGMVKPVSSQTREVKPMSPGSPVKERRLMMPAGSPMGSRRHLKPSGSPVVDRRPMKPGGSPVVERRPLRPSGSPVVDRRMLDNGQRTDTAFVSGSPVSGRRHSKKVPGYSTTSGSVNVDGSNGFPSSKQRQRMTSPLRDNRQSGIDSSTATRRDVVNVGDELRNGQQRGVGLTPSRTNGTEQAKVQDYANNSPVSHSEPVPNGIATPHGSHGQYQVQQGYQVHHEAVPGNHNRTHPGYDYDNGYPESQRNTSYRGGGEMLRDGRQFSDTNTQSQVPSHFLLNSNSAPPNQSGNTYVPNNVHHLTNYSGHTHVSNNAGNGITHSGNTYVPHHVGTVTNHADSPFGLNNAGSVTDRSGSTPASGSNNTTSVVYSGQGMGSVPGDRQKRRIPTCDDSSSEDENFYVYNRVKGQQHGGHILAQTQAVTSGFPNSPYKVSSF